MELIKDVIRYLLGGMIENLAEWKASEKRRAYFHYREGKKAKFCCYVSWILVIGLLFGGVLALVKKKIWGILLLLGGLGLTLAVLFDWGIQE